MLWNKYWISEIVALILFNKNIVVGMWLVVPVSYDAVNSVCFFPNKKFRYICNEHTIYGILVMRKKVSSFSGNGEIRSKICK
jgi:hypothetical protein